MHEVWTLRCWSVAESTGLLACKLQPQPDLGQWMSCDLPTTGSE